MNLSDFLRRVSCPDCGWHAVWGPETCLEELQKLGMLRREKQPTPQWILQLTAESRDRLSCADCRHVGLQLEAWTDDFDDAPGTRPCEVCGQLLAPERLEIFPDATRCAGCQDAPSAGQHADDYCPRCGEILQVRLAGGSGTARYRCTCPACGYRG